MNDEQDPEESIHPIVELDGVLIQVVPPDLDGDGQVGGIERITNRAAEGSGILPVSQPSELGESLDRLDDDSIDESTRMTKMDMNANLDKFEEPFILSFDALISLGMLPERALHLTRQKKRLSVSRDALGRKQKVEMVAGKREHDRSVGGSVVDKIRGAFGRGGE